MSAPDVPAADIRVHCRICGGHLDVAGGWPTGRAFPDHSRAGGGQRLCPGSGSRPGAVRSLGEGARAGRPAGQRRPAAPRRPVTPRMVLQALAVAAVVAVVAVLVAVLATDRCSDLDDWLTDNPDARGPLADEYRESCGDG